jgi:3-hydroxyacyl-CoA dehydrogenase
MRRAAAATRDPRERYVAILDALCEQGRLGRKTGAGYYSYADGQKSASTDATVHQIIEAASKQRGIARTPLPAVVIQRRALLAMVNEAALLLAEGVAQSASDIDVVLLQGYGFPREKGGLVTWAGSQERAALDREIQELATAAGHGFRVADLSPLLNI